MSHFALGMNNQVSTFTAEAVTFDGTNDYLTNSSPTNPSAGDLFIFSAWWYMSSANVASIVTLNNSIGNRIVEFKHNTSTSPDRVMEVIIKNSSDALSHYYRVDANMNLNTWNHWLCAMDASTSATKEIWLNDVKQTVNTVTDTTDAIPYNLVTDMYVGQTQELTTPYTGDLSEVYFTNEYLDFDTESNRRKFITSDGKPVDLGSDGSTPTGTQPLIYMTGAASVWNAGTNAGSAGNFTMSGSVTDSSNEPVET